MGGRHKVIRNRQQVVGGGPANYCLVTDASALGQAMSLRNEAVELGKRAKEASRRLAKLSSEEKNLALLRMAERLEGEREAILGENRKDPDLARAAGLSRALLDRIALNPARIQAMGKGLREIAALPDPVGEIVKMWRRPPGFRQWQ